MPVVMDNHFESNATRNEGESLVKNSVNSTYGTILNFFNNYFANVKANKAAALPAFMVSFAMLNMGLPMPAFAASKALATAAPAVATSAYTKLLKNVFCAVLLLFLLSLLFIQLMLSKQECKLLKKEKVLLEKSLDKL
jgi:hypothetical protein